MLNLLKENNLDERFLQVQLLTLAKMLKYTLEMLLFQANKPMHDHKNG